MKRYFKHKHPSDKSWKLGRIYIMENNTMLFDGGSVCNGSVLESCISSGTYFDEVTEREYNIQEGILENTYQIY